MSDDTRDTPTERINAAIIEDDLQEEKQKSRGLLIGLIAAGALLLAAIIVLVFIVSRNTDGGGTSALPTPGTTSGPSSSPTDEASATPDPTPSAIETDEPDDGDDGDDSGQSDPPPTGAAFTAFNPKNQVECDKGGPNFTPPPPPIKISWSTVRTQSAWIVGGTSDAADSQFMQIPVNGNQSDFQYELQFPCFQSSTKYTITLVGTDGQHVSKTWKVTNVGDHD